MQKIAFNKKGQATVIGTIITIVLLFVLFLIITMFAKTQSDMKESLGTSVSTAVVNETYASTILATLFSTNEIITLNVNVNDSYYKTLSVSQIVANATGAAYTVLGSGNYSVDSARGRVTVLNSSIEDAESPWNVSYTYTLYDDRGSSKINIESLVGVSDAAGDNASSMYLIVVAVLIIVFVIIIMTTVQKMRG